ncbi:hypothetical protein DPMN_097624 [Dreissena polymorpha]|uniref:Uncharacterized protein n=1 Tax=Dreissena polymorpha TaxID=45954 RepID=A0A9D4LC34_DREPO|nr:hypothetical protein DPMN_097624 [Dreissena polymorpha]
MRHGKSRTVPYRTDSEAYREPYRGETITIYRPTEYRDTLNNNSTWYDRGGSQYEELEDNMRDLEGIVSAEQAEETMDEPEERTTDEAGEEAVDMTGQGAEILHGYSIETAE